MIAHSKRGLVGMHAPLAAANDNIADNTPPPNHSRSGIFLIIRMLVLAIMPFMVVEGAIYQLQMFVTGGSTPISFVALKLIILLLLTAALLLRSTRVSNRQTTQIALLFALYLLCVALYQYLILDLDIIDILGSYNSYYLVFFLNCLALLVPLNISDKKLTRIVVITFLICAFVGLAQYIEQSPLLPTSNSDGTFKINVWQSHGNMRVFSLFSAPGFFGMFSAFVAALALASLRGKRNIYGLPLLILGVSACLISSTRTELVGMACALMTAYILTYKRTSKVTRYLPVFYLPAGLLVGIYAFFQSASGGANQSLGDTTSFTARLYEWGYYISTFRVSDWPKMLFGYGIVQNGATKGSAAIVAIDNLYLATVLHIGIIGLVLLMLLSWWLWLEVWKAAVLTRSSLLVAVAASYSTLWVVGIFALGSAQMATILLLFSICSIDSIAYATTKVQAFNTELKSV